MGIKTFTQVAAKVIHPVMSKIQHDKSELQKYFYQALQYCAVLMFGIGGLIAVLSDPLVRVLYTPIWYDMIVPMQLIGIAMAVGSLNMVPGSFLKAVNRTDLLFKVSLINLPMFVIILWVTVQYSIVAVAAGQILLAVLRFIPTFIVMRRVMDITVNATFSVLFPALVCTGAAMVSVSAVLFVVQGADILRLFAGTLTYGITFLTALYFLMPEPFTVGRRLIARKWSKA